MRLEVWMHKYITIKRQQLTFSEERFEQEMVNNVAEARKEGGD